jgi:hypothetical protein
MHGHMWEWCWDWYAEDYYRHSPVDDPQGPSSGSLRIERSGDGWNSDSPHLRSAYRNRLGPSSRYRDLGFRVARTSNKAPLAKADADGGKDDSPTRILEKRGLVRPRGTASNWILKEEIDVLARFRLVRAQEKQLDWGREQYNALAAGSRSRQAFIEECDARINALRGMRSEVDRLLADNPFMGTGIAAYYHNLLVQQHNALLAEYERLVTMRGNFFRDGGDFQEQLRQFGKELEKMEKWHVQTFEELRDWLAEINKRYEMLGADDEIATALSDLSTPTKQRIVPSKELRDATQAVTGGAGRIRVEKPNKQGQKRN